MLKFPMVFKGFRPGCARSRLSPSGACAHRWRPTWIVAKNQAFLQRFTEGLAGSSRAPRTVPRMPAGGAVYCLTENAQISNEIKGFRPRCSLVQRSRRAAPGRVVKKDSGFLRFGTAAAAEHATLYEWGERSGQRF